MEESKLPEYITFDNHGEPKIIASLLAKHVRENLVYKIVRNNGISDQQIYVYSDGTYKLCSQELFKGYIKKFVSDYNEACGWIYRKHIERCSEIIPTSSTSKTFAKCWAVSAQKALTIC